MHHTHTLSLSYMHHTHTLSLSYMHHSHTLSPECPLDKFRSSGGGEVAVTRSGQITIDTLADLRLRLNYAKDRYRLAEAQLEETKLMAYYLEDIVNARNQNKLSGEVCIHWSFSHPPSSALQYYWFVHVRPMILACASILCVCLSLLSFLGIVGSIQGVDFNVSLYWKIVHMGTHSGSGPGVVIFVLLTLGYIAAVTNWAMFQIKIAGSMEMVAFRTTPESLSFNARMVSRLSAPLAFFYLGWLAENGTEDGFWVYWEFGHQIVNSTTVYITNSTYAINTANGTNSTVNNMRYVSLFDLAETNVTTLNTTNVTYTPDDILYTPALLMHSAFANFYQLQVIPAMGDAFNTFYPILLLSVMFLVVTNPPHKSLQMFNHNSTK